MIAARGQAESYVRALADDNPPFLLVIDIGFSFELFADFSRLGKVYAAFPDARSHRFSIEALRDPSIRDRLKTLWLDPLALDPSRRAAKVTRDIAGRIAILAKRLEAKGHDAEGVAWFLMRCLFTFFAEDVGLVAKAAFTDLLVSIKDSPESFVPLVSDLWKAMDSGGFSAALRATPGRRRPATRRCEQGVVRVAPDRRQLLAGSSMGLASREVLSESPKRERGECGS